MSIEAAVRLVVSCRVAATLHIGLPGSAIDAARFPNEFFTTATENLVHCSFGSGDLPMVFPDEFPNFLFSRVTGLLGNHRPPEKTSENEMSRDSLRFFGKLKFREDSRQMPRISPETDSVRFEFYLKFAFENCPAEINPKTIGLETPSVIFASFAEVISHNRRRFSVSLDKRSRQQVLLRASEKLAEKAADPYPRIANPCSHTTSFQGSLFSIIS